MYANRRKSRIIDEYIPLDAVIYSNAEAAEGLIGGYWFHSLLVAW
jgi:hypothetical protein